jgi:hypothetical protein
MKRISNFLQKYPWLAHVVALIGAGWYAFQTWTMAHSLTTMILDESMYVYKGYLFAIGKYTPYQDYGLLTNHMPLSFIIPGYVQRIFGPGMLTARVFAFIVSLVMLAGFWLVFKRLGGNWWGAFIVGVFALNPAWQEVFSQSLTQGLVNAFIAWGLVLLIGDKRTKLQMAFAGGLFALAVMTRINTLPILALMVVYAFWQHGWRKGLSAAFGGLLVGTVVLAMFWPGVLKFMSTWIPEGWLAFVDPYRSPWSQQHVPRRSGSYPVVWVESLRRSDQLQPDPLHGGCRYIIFLAAPPKLGLLPAQTAVGDTACHLAGDGRVAHLGSLIRAQLPFLLSGRVFHLLQLHRAAPAARVLFQLAQVSIWLA